MKQITLILLITTSYLSSYGQEQQVDCANTIRINQITKNFKIFKYPENFKIEKLNSFDKVKNKSPEQLMRSVISATNLDWYNFNREEKKQNSSQDFAYIKQVSPEAYYVKLLYKVSFEASGFKYAIIKYNLLDNKKPVLGYAEAMKKRGERWFTTSEEEISQFSFFMIMIDTKYIDNIFNNTRSDNSNLNQILNLNQFNGIININDVLNDLQKQLTESRGNLKSILDPNRLFK
ncbi:hypothetical protein VOI54_14355 [Tamlana sp. 2201CG12-4]|uniref:hypothetical protein n=1 Tax=Tamlana sp. 2201CG12-4 TaxID=3112582 RepID=UPI002DB99610|nr:hypothetical protein [Tamlana sp. 2201CG12-4]MEC3908209.1 hypothetical protein [Tamlana sp. 2201CG12-4]